MIPRKIAATPWWRSGAAPIWLLVLAAAGGFVPHDARAATAEAAAPSIGPDIPADIATPGGAPAATLEEAARYAWEEFIALNWPADAKLRDAPDRQASMADTDRPRRWETMRGRVEVYPGTGSPAGDAGSGQAYGFDRPPQYIYDPDRVHSAATQVAGTTQACPGAAASGPVPWHNLDEPDHGNAMSGLSPEGPFPGQQLLLESKVNREHYIYVVSRGWYGQEPMRRAKRRTGEFVRGNQYAPPPERADDPQNRTYVSFPNGEMELKAAWRRLGPLDDKSHFLTAPVRYYEQLKDGRLCHHDSGADPKDVWGMVAMHVMHKTPSAPYFVWATFEQAETLVANKPDAAGHPIAVELPDGSPNPAAPPSASTYTPSITVVPATQEDDQTLTFGHEVAEPGLSLYYNQAADTGLPEIARININRALHTPPDAIIRANRSAQAALQARFPGLPLTHYRLVSLQFKPIDKAAGQVLMSGDRAIYYASSVSIEPGPVQQEFSGQFLTAFAKASDYLHPTMKFLNPEPNPRAPVFVNAFFQGHSALSGGCMGCHGSQQAYGTDWSFLFDRQRVTAPEVK